MRKILLPWAAFLGTAISLVSSSCTYDPYYSSAGGYYGYGDGYGYGGSNFSTSFFVTTDDPRWGYDPYTYCYYDYRSRRYYDPYLYGYYPVGYRPYAVYGVPHPHDWRPGHGHCPPPRTVRNVTVVNYRDRESAYRNLNYSWARQVKHRPVQNSYRPYDGRKPDYKLDSRSRQSYDHDSSDSRTWSPRETHRTRESKKYDSHGSYDRSQHDDFRPTGRPSPQQAVRTAPRQTTREFRPETTRGQSMTRPQPSQQPERTREIRSRNSDQPRGKAPSSDSPEKKADSWKPERKGLRSLGDA